LFVITLVNALVNNFLYANIFLTYFTNSKNIKLILDFDIN